MTTAVDLSAQIAEQVKAAASRGSALKIRGQGSKDFLGRNTQGESLSLADHRGVVSYNPSELVITVRAGTTLIEIEQLLSEQGQMLACDPPRFDDRGSIGGSLACNLSGPARPWVGSIRDAVLGVTLIDGRGEQLAFGGRVMKNVAGYDVSRLQAGAMGCLGVMTEISLKLVPIPERTATLSLACEDSLEAIDVMNRLSGQSLPLTGAVWINDSIYLRLQGSGGGVEKAVKDMQADRASTSLEPDNTDFWASLRDHKLDYFERTERLGRLSLRSTAGHQGFSPGVVDWAGAQRWVALPQGLESAAEGLEPGVGEISLFRGHDGDEPVFHPMDMPRQTLHRRLKTSFDPEGILNPGRLFDWL